jgi:hypothetical protein
MFQPAQCHVTLGGRKDSSWDRSFTVRKAPALHGKAFDKRLFGDNEPRDTRTTDEILQRLLASEDALDPKGPCNVFLREFLRDAKYRVLITPGHSIGLLRTGLAVFDDRRERENCQDALRDWGNPIYRKGPSAEKAAFGVVDERELHAHLSKKVRLLVEDRSYSIAD